MLKYSAAKSVAALGVRECDDFIHSLYIMHWILARLQLPTIPSAHVSARVCV